MSAAGMTTVAGDDGWQVVWLHARSERRDAGPLALVRARAVELGVYAIGSFEGSSGHSRFQIARIKTTAVVAAVDDGCADVQVDTECESRLTIYLMIGGQLVPAAVTAVARIQVGTLKEIGTVQFRLSTDPPVFDAGAVRIRERVSVRDTSDEEIRKAEGERMFVLQGGELIAQKDSLWNRVVGQP